MRRLLAVAMLVASTAASAQSPGPSEIAADAARRAAEIAARTPDAPWGCTVLLCLANPNGPTAVAQCVDPIRRLWRELRRGRVFPSCPMARGPQGGAFARVGYDPHNPCPPGTEELAAGRLVQAAVVRTLTPSSADPSALPESQQLGEPITVEPAGAGTEASFHPQVLPPRICGGRYLGERMSADPDGYRSVSVFDVLTIIPASTSPSFVEVLIDRGDGQGPRSWGRIRF